MILNYLLILLLSVDGYSIAFRAENLFDKQDKIMQIIRQIYGDALNTILVREAFHHRRLEVLAIVQEEILSPPRLKTLLADMPDVGDNADISRLRDFER